VPFVAKLTLWVLLSVVVLPPGTASAGGNWIEWDDRYHVPGDTVVARNIFYPGRSANARQKIEAAGPYFAYLGAETSGWGLPDPADESTIRLGRIELIWPGKDSPFKGHMRFNPRARIRFTVPDVPEGRYVVAFCNQACTHRLADNVDATGGFTVVPTAIEARLRPRIDRLRADLYEHRREAGGKRNRLERKLLAANARGREMGETLGALGSETRSLRAELAGVRSELRARPTVSQLVVAAALVFAVVVIATVLTNRGYSLFGLTRRRRRASSLPDLDPELERLLASADEARQPVPR